MPAKKATKGARGTPKKATTVTAVAPSLASHSDGTKAKALQAFTISGTVKGACEAAHIGRRTWYNWMEEDSAFAAAAIEAADSVTDELEAEAIKRAKNGSDTLVIFLLKSRRPGQYREKQEVTVVHADVKARLTEQARVMASRTEWSTKDLFAALEAVWA